ncbi:hypothetical protein RGR602_CH02835 [Rhizobium gallicum bv. gallicum R602sp]|uniref:Uncharacterized protein n=1 Tax=Rhizobium gallicum bv. gallicum R602sp TaxID=1041138 RepID=A0A0B4X6I1_9HYPH|nr:hypothetical protein RGR602_CH02835 [Rhizobium gallicum bv. gallicum R602sp]
MEKAPESFLVSGEDARFSGAGVLRRTLMKFPSELVEMPTSTVLVREIRLPAAFARYQTVGAK